MVGVKENLGDGLYIIDGYYEKPGPENAPSRLACVCGYVLAPSIMKHLSMDNVSPRGEVEMAAAIDALSREEDVYGLVIQGEYHDTGSPELYLQTLVDIALNDESYGERFRQYLKDKI